MRLFLLKALFSYYCKLKKFDVFHHKKTVFRSFIEVKSSSLIENYPHPLFFIRNSAQYSPGRKRIAPGRIAFINITLI